MKTLWDCGYQEIKKLQKLVSLVDALDAILVDVRYSPNSRDPQWRQRAIEKKLGLRYFHLRDLGNKAYKQAGTIEFVDLPRGIATLARFLQSNNVIILCGCWNRENCHRVKIVEAFEHEYGQKSIPLTLDLANEIIASINPATDTDTQFSLF
jgi:hypothetical protein